jgi:RNA binding exosome subunit
MRLPESLTLRDLITIISVAVSITLAWGYFGSRITVLENEVIALKEEKYRMRAELDSLRARTHVLESQVRESEVFMDQVFRELKQPAPRRRYNTTPGDYPLYGRDAQPNHRDPVEPGVFPYIN